MNLIEQYLLGQLNEQEREAVEERLRTDVAFRTEYEQYRLAVEVVRLSGRQALKTQLKARGQAMARRRRGRLLLGLGLGVALLLLFLRLNDKSTQGAPSPPFKPVWNDTIPKATDTLPLQAQDKSTPALPGKQQRRRDLYAEYYRPFSDDALNGSTRGTEPKPYSYEGYLALYASGNYPAAVLRFDSLPSVTRDNATIRFLYAQTLLHEGRTREALVYFDALMETRRFQYAQEAAWYGALCLLKTREYGAAKARLGAIAEAGGHPYREEASRLLQALP